jgi:hypothetical protein
LRYELNPRLWNAKKSRNGSARTMCGSQRSQC